MYRRSDSDGENSIYVLEMSSALRSRFRSGDTVGMIPQKIRLNHSTGSVSIYRCSRSHSSEEFNMAVEELSRYGLRKVSKAMRLSKEMISLSSKLQPYRNVLSDFDISANGRKTQFGPYASLVSSGATGPNIKKKLYNILNLTEKGRLEDVDWILSVPKHGGQTPILYSYKAARMTEKGRRNADLVDAVLPNPGTGKLDGGVRIRCTKDEFQRLAMKLLDSPELKWAYLAFTHSVSPVRDIEKEKKEERSRLIGERVKERANRGRQKGCPV